MVGDEAKPPCGFGVVLPDALAAAVHPAEVELRFDLSLFGSAPVPPGGFGKVLRNDLAVSVYAAESHQSITAVPTEPSGGFGEVLRDALTTGIHPPEGVLSAPSDSFSLLSSEAKPPNSLHAVLWNPAAPFVIQAEEVLRFCVPLLGRPAEPRRGFHVVGQLQAELELRLGIPPLSREAIALGRLTIPPGGFGWVLWDAQADGVRPAEVGLRFGVPLLGSETIPLGGLGEVLGIDVAALVRAADHGELTGLVHRAEVELRGWIAPLRGPEDGHRRVLGTRLNDNEDRDGDESQPTGGLTCRHVCPPLSDEHDITPGLLMSGGRGGQRRSQ